jgi:Bacterial Ig domain
MKRLFWILILLGSAHFGMAQIVSFSFSPSQETITGFTSVYGDPHVAVRTGTANGISITTVSTSNWSPSSSDGCAASGIGAYPTYYMPGMANCYLQYNGTAYNLALYNALVPQLELTGLNPDSSYILRMSASDVALGGSTTYTVAGASVAGSQTLTTWHNQSQGITFQHVYPDGTGMIKVYVNGSSTSDYAFISGIEIFSGSANVGTPVVALTTPTNGTIFSEGGNITITATASETGNTIAQVQFYADTTLIGQATAAPYTMTWTDPNPGSYQITAKATDNVGTINTAQANIAIESLNYFWSTTGNIATSGDTFFVGTVDTNRLAFRTNNVERMTILKDGTIGIGTKTTYGYALAVNGTAIFTKAKVKTAGTWPDYVFKPDYILPDLKDLERYLKEHQHLPDIASEKTVQREGIDIAEQQAALLKKVEELTLYLIQQNKKIEAQQKELDKLKARIKTQK